VLFKLFQHVTYSQRNKLLNTEISLPNVCQPLTLQEAERKIVQEGEAAFAFSQEGEAPRILPELLPTATNNKVILFRNNTATQGNMEETSRHLGIISTEGLGAFRHAFWLFHIKNIAKIFANTFLQNGFISLSRIPTEDKAEMLFGPPGLYAKSKEVD